MADKLSLLLKDIHFVLALMVKTYQRDACAYGKVDVVTKYVDANKEMAKISTKDGETCLHLTAISNSFDISKMMVDLGADVNKRVTHTEVSFEGCMLHAE